MPFVKAKKLKALKEDSYQLTMAKKALADAVIGVTERDEKISSLEIALKKTAEERDQWKDIVRNRMRNYGKVTADEISDTNINEKENS